MSDPATKPTLRMKFDEFFTRVYGVKPSEVQAKGLVEQHKQLLDAFFGGCLTAYTSDCDFRLDLMLHWENVHLRAQAEAKYAN